MAAIKKPAEKSKKVQTFTYEGKDARGTSIKGEINAVNLSLAKADLRRQGLVPTKLKRKAKPLFNFSTKKRIKAADICTFSRQMATMMASGVPLVQSFDIIAKGTDNESVQDLVTQLKNDVEGGLSFSEALSKHPKYFDQLFCNLVYAGESSGALEAMLDRIATYKEKSESLKRKIKKALFYPTAVTVVAIIVTAILLIFVVPQFQELFKGFGADLPAFTLLVIHISNVVRDWWWGILLMMITAGFFFIQGKRRSPRFQHFLDRLSVRIPVIGPILHKAAIARFARTLATTFAAGVPLVEALDAVAKASGNIIYSTAIYQIREEVATGSQIQFSMRNTGIFPNMVVQMIAIGEESGALDHMLEKVANIYEEEVDTAVDGLSSLLEPLIMAVLGVLVGGLVIAMYLPIFKMGSVI